MDQFIPARGSAKSGLESEEVAKQAFMTMMKCVTENGKVYLTHPGRCNGKVYFKELAERALQAEEARIEHERLAAAPMDISKNDKKNEEGYFDMTAYKAMTDKPTANENERFRKLLHTIFHLCELAGFELVGRITVRDRKTNRIWK